MGANDVLIFLGLLQAKHFICDGPLQTFAMVQQKRLYGAPLGLLHAGLHGLGTALVALAWLGPGRMALILAALDFAIHYHVDFTKENVVKHFGWTPTQGPFWWALSFDQMLHQLTYLVLAALSFQT